MATRKNEQTPDNNETQSDKGLDAIDRLAASSSLTRSEIEKELEAFERDLIADFKAAGFMDANGKWTEKAKRPSSPQKPKAPRPE